METQKPIGVFDSGVGGLSVLRELRRCLPGEDYLYLGDTARCPYGDRALPHVKAFAFEIMDFLLTRQVKAVVMACNISSSVALEAAQEYYHIPVYGLINEYTVAGVAAAAPGGKAGLLATTGTVRSQAYQRALRHAHAGITVTAVPCPQFVPLVEAGELSGPRARAAVTGYCEPLCRAGVETVILGCTHYPFLAPLISDVVGPEITLFDPAASTVALVADDLERRQLRNRQPAGGTAYLVSGSRGNFRKTVVNWMGESQPRIEPTPWE